MRSITLQSSRTSQSRRFNPTQQTSKGHFSSISAHKPLKTIIQSRHQIRQFAECFFGLGVIVFDEIIREIHASCENLAKLSSRGLKFPDTIVETSVGCQQISIHDLLGVGPAKSTQIVGSCGRPPAERANDFFRLSILCIDSTQVRQFFRRQRCADFAKSSKISSFNSFKSQPIRSKSQGNNFPMTLVGAPLHHNHYDDCTKGRKDRQHTRQHALIFEDPTSSGPVRPMPSQLTNSPEPCSKTGLFPEWWEQQARDTRPGRK